MGGAAAIAQDAPAVAADSVEQAQEPRIRPEDVPADVPRAAGPGTPMKALQRSVRSEGAADEGSDLVLRTPDGTERMRFTAVGNAGIGTATPSAKLHVNGPGMFGKTIVAMPWTNTPAPPPGYIKLVTPIVHNESNMFQIHIVGYRYFPTGDSIDILCSGYAYAPYYLIRTSCETRGTDLPVEIGSETRPGGTDPVVVVRIGTPTTAWYYAHFAAEYQGWVTKSPSDFQWVAGETTPAQTGNTNNIIADDLNGRLTVGPAGTAPTVNRLTVNGASTFSGRVGIGTTGPSELLHLNAADTTYAAIRLNTGTNQGGMLSLMGPGYTAQPTSAHKPDALVLMASEVGGLALVSGNATNGAIRLYTAGTGPGNERMTVTQTGNVGIGTANPVQNSK
jgi:hypothetical protein